MSKRKLPPHLAGAYASGMNPRTEAIRARIRLTPEQRQEVKQMRDWGWPWPDIAIVLGESEEDIQLAVANVRTPNPHRWRATANISLNADAHIKSQMRPGETVMQVIDRLLGV